jgi:AhpD family alkylhydroperoxidase
MVLYFNNQEPKYMESQKTPMDLLKEFTPEFAKHQLDDKTLLFENEKYQTVPRKYKRLAGIAAAAVLGSDTCVRMWVKQAKTAGANNQEITEAIMVARYMKQAVVNDTVANTFQLLSDNNL